MTFRQAFRFSATTPEGLRDELNTFVERLQVGALPLYGLKLDDTTRTTAPSVAPDRGSPNLVIVDVGGTKTLYLWDGSAWVVAGSQ